MFTKKFTVIISFFLIIAIGVGGMLGYYDARLEAAVTPKKQSMDKVKIKNEEDLTFDKDVVFLDQVTCFHIYDMIRKRMGAMSTTCVIFKVDSVT